MAFHIPIPSPRQGDLEEILRVDMKDIHKHIPSPIIYGIFKFQAFCRMDMSFFIIFPCTSLYAFIFL